MIYEKSYMDPNAVIERAILIQQLFKECNDIPVMEINFQGCWQPPQEGFFKLNIEWALFFDLKKAGVGVIL